ncbi:MAG: hypothetical protein QW272_09780 [Candidatus Methanomethylicaceae archaeon]
MNDIYLETKDAFAILSKDECRSYFFFINGKVLVIDYIPCNYPELVIATMSKEEAEKRIAEMGKNFWLLVKYKEV